MKLAVALLTLISVVVGQTTPQPPTNSALPTTLIISVINSATGAKLGTLNGHGNFSSPGPSYPLRAYSNGAGSQYIYGFGTCTVDGVLDCDGDAGTYGVFSQQNKDVALSKTGTLFSVDALTDAAGGTNEWGLPNGIPVYIGDVAAVPVVLQVAAASG